MGQKDRTPQEVPALSILPTELVEAVAEVLYDREGAQQYETDGGVWDDYVSFAERHIRAIPVGWSRDDTGVWTKAGDAR